MSKERLEEIEAKYSILSITSKQGGIEYTEVEVEDLEFLIQNGFKQADRVHELEQQNKRYREALEFYADEETYESLEVPIGAVTKRGYKISKYKYDPIINTDRGKKAHKALECEDETK